MTLSLSNYLAADSAARALRRDVYDGLTQTPKSLPPKWFYDSAGSDLFDQITRLPEYYPTRAEAEILRDRATEIAAASGADTLVELGSGTSEKTRLLLERPARPRIAAPLHPVRRRRESAAGRKLLPSSTSTRASRSTPSVAISRSTSARSRRSAGGWSCSSGSTIGNLTTEPRAEFLAALSDSHAARRHPAARHRPGQGHRPAGAGLRRRRRRDGAVQQERACGGQPGTRRRTSTSTPSTTSRGGTPTRNASRCGCAQAVRSMCGSARWTSPSTSPQARRCSPRCRASSGPTASTRNWPPRGCAARTGGPTRQATSACRSSVTVMLADDWRAARPAARGRARRQCRLLAAELRGDRRDGRPRTARGRGRRVRRRGGRRARRSTRAAPRSVR